MANIETHEIVCKLGRHTDRQGLGISAAFDPCSCPQKNKHGSAPLRGGIGGRERQSPATGGAHEAPSVVARRCQENVPSNHGALERTAGKIRGKASTLVAKFIIFQDDTLLMYVQVH